MSFVLDLQSTTENSESGQALAARSSVSILDFTCTGSSISIWNC